MALMMQITSLSAQVETALRKEIQEGEIQPGERIDLARYQKSWDVSITPLRDAVRGLEKDGLVTIEPRKGVFVLTIDEKLLGLFMKSMELSMDSMLRGGKDAKTLNHGIYRMGRGPRNQRAEVRVQSSRI